MKQYLDLINYVLESGTWQENRTGIKTISIPGAMMRFDLQQGFPAVTTKKLAFKTAMGELIGFLRGSRNAAEFRALGCKVWDQNANDNTQWLASPYREQEDDLGAIYGVQWRNWPAYKLLNTTQSRQIEDAVSLGYYRIGVISENGDEKILLYKAIDQLRQCLETIINNPSDRRILFHAWNCAQIEEMALPPCHLLYQILPNSATREISLCVYIRSNDLGLGAPFNIAEGAALLHLIGRLTGYKPRWFTYFIGDTHIYENHLAILKEQLERKPFDAPQLYITKRIPDFAETGKFEPEWLERVEPSDFILENYRHHSPLKAKMAI